MFVVGTSFSPAQNITKQEQIKSLYTQVNDLLAVGDTINARFSLGKLLKLDKSNRSDIYLALGRIAEDHHETDNAINYYRQAIKSDKKSHRAYYSLGTLYYNQAVDILNNADRLLPFAPKLYKTETAKALTFMEKALPYLVEGFRLSGKEEIYQPALETIQQIIANHPKK